MKDIVIIGAGGCGREVAWLINDINMVQKTWNVVGFVDDNADILGSEVNDIKVVGNVEWLKTQQLYAVNAVGNPLVKKKIMQELKDSKNKYPILIHPSVIYSDKVSFGEGSIICAGTIITVNIKIGSHVIINYGCTIGHDANLGDYTTVLPGVSISGSVTTEECVSIGTGSVIIPTVTIGQNTVIGAGATVVKSLPANCTAIGAPAKPIKFHQNI